MSELLKINVNEKTEKKGQLTYLSWAWAWAEVLKIDPDATWEAAEYEDACGVMQPCMFLPDGSAIVKTIVTIKGKDKRCHLPVMDHKNNAIKNPDARKISDAIMRCMTKAIGMHGLGLYIYAGEDLPEGEDAPQEPDHRPPELTAYGKKVDRTLVMKVRRAIADHLANDRELGALQEWEEAVSISEDFASDVWHGLTTPERDKIRTLRGSKVQYPEK